jgi:hypothetical protein
MADLFLGKTNHRIYKFSLNLSLSRRENAKEIRAILPVIRQSLPG